LSISNIKDVIVSGLGKREVLKIPYFGHSVTGQLPTSSIRRANIFTLVLPCVPVTKTLPFLDEGAAEFLAVREIRRDFSGGGIAESIIGVPRLFHIPRAPLAKKKKNAIDGPFSSDRGGFDQVEITVPSLRMSGLSCSS